MQEDHYIATAMAFYIKATEPDITLAKAAGKAQAIAGFNFDIDHQLAFKKGFRQAEEMNDDHGKGNCCHDDGKMERAAVETMRMLKLIFADIQSLRYDIHNFARYPGQMIGGGGGGGAAGANQIVPAGGGGGGEIDPMFHIDINQRADPYSWRKD
jgi:hypothetical protein